MEKVVTRCLDTLINFCPEASFSSLATLPQEESGMSTLQCHNPLSQEKFTGLQELSCCWSEC